MDRLSYVILFTGDIAGMRRFYEQSVDLATRKVSPEWVEFDTGGATLALQAMPDARKRGVELRFVTTDIETRVRDLATRGVTVDPPGIETFAWGRHARLSDPEGNSIMILQLAHPLEPGKGPGLTVVVNCVDLAKMKAYYRGSLGFAASIDSPWWVQLSVGEAGLGLHPRVGQTVAEKHHARGITIGLGIPDLEGWHEEARERGLAFASPPTDRGFGTFADAVDPDGNEVTFRDVPEPETLEEKLAEPFDEGEAPQRGAIRKSVKKRATAGSRLVNKPAYRAAKPSSKPARAAKATSRAASTRGSGPAGAHKTSKRQGGTPSAGTKPATGRLRKAERRTLERKKVSVAAAGKSKPVKRAATRTVKSRAPAKRVSGRAGRGGNAR